MLHLKEQCVLGQQRPGEAENGGGKHQEPREPQGKMPQGK